MKHFPAVSPEVHERLARRGINVEQSYEWFQAEIRVQPPPLLLAHLRLPGNIKPGQVLCDKPWKNTA